MEIVLSHQHIWGDIRAVPAGYGSTSLKHTIAFCRYERRRFRGVEEGKRSWYLQRWTADERQYTEAWTTHGSQKPTRFFQCNSELSIFARLRIGKWKIIGFPSLIHATTLPRIFVGFIYLLICLPSGVKSPLTRDMSRWTKGCDGISI